MADQSSGSVAKVAVVATGADGAAQFAEVDLPLAADIDALRMQVRVRDAGSESPWHGAPAGCAVLVLVLDGWLGVQVGGDAGDRKDFGPGDWILFQDDADVSVAAGKKAGHKSMVRPDSAVRQVAVVLKERFPVSL